MRCGFTSNITCFHLSAEGSSKHILSEWMVSMFGWMLRVFKSFVLCNIWAFKVKHSGCYTIFGIYRILWILKQQLHVEVPSLATWLAFDYTHTHIFRPKYISLRTDAPFHILSFIWFVVPMYWYNRMQTINFTFCLDC